MAVEQADGDAQFMRFRSGQGRANADPDTKANQSAFQMRAHWLELIEELEGAPALDPLRSFRIEAMDIWPIIKTSLVMATLNSDQRTAVIPRKRAVPPLRWLRDILPRAVGLAEFDCEALFLANTAPAMIVNGILLNPHTDPLRCAFESRGLSTLTAYYDARDLGPTALTAIAMSGMIGRHPKAAETKGLRAVEQLLDDYRVSSRAGRFIEPENVTKRIAQVMSLREFYVRIFDANRSVRYLFLTNYYGVHGWAAIDAAKTRGIVCTDIQHGVQGRFHHAYSWPEIRQQALSCLPDRYLCWAEEDIDNLQQYAPTHGRATLIGPGQLQLERLANPVDTGKQPPVRGLDDYRSLHCELQAQASQFHSAGKTIACLFLQYKEGSEWLMKLRAALPGDVELWVRRHPGLRRLQQAPIASAGIRYVDDYPLSSILRAMDVAVMGYSSVGREAAYVGCPVVAYSPIAKQFLEAECRATGFTLVDQSPDAVARAIVAAPKPQRELERPLPDLNKIADSFVDKKNTQSEESRLSKHTGFLPDTRLLEPDVVMLAANDGWDIRALKEARSLAASGLSVVLVGRHRDPHAIDRFVDDQGVQILTVPTIGNEQTMRLLLQHGVWQRMTLFERVLSYAILQLLTLTDYRIYLKRVPPPISADLLARIKLASRRGKRRQVAPSSYSPWVLGFVRGVSRKASDAETKIRRSLGAGKMASVAVAAVRVAKFAVLLPFWTWKSVATRATRSIASLVNYLHSTQKPLLKPLAAVARAWRKVGQRVYKYSRFFLFTVEYGETVARLKPKVIHAHDLYTLQAAVRIAAWTGAKVVYDAHELESDRYLSITRTMKRWTIAQEKKYAPQASACVTVSNAIADEMERELQVERPTVVFNAPVTTQHDPTVERSTVRSELNLGETTPLFVFVGKVYELYKSNQRVGLIIEALAQCPGYHLAIVGPVGPTAEKQIEELKDRLGIHDRLHLIPPIPAESIIHFIRDADVGVYFMWPDTRNIDLTIPNKLFEFSLAGLPIVVSDLTSTRWFVEQAGNAVLVKENTPEAVADACRTMYAKAKTTRPTPERLAELRRDYSWEAQELKLLDLYQNKLRIMPKRP
jgi:glycosyltransferase involved in cell wall biosynthesis